MAHFQNRVMWVGQEQSIGLEGRPGLEEGVKADMVQQGPPSGDERETEEVLKPGVWREYLHGPIGEEGKEGVVLFDLHGRLKALGAMLEEEKGAG
jgi:hypothetical protein